MAKEADMNSPSPSGVPYREQAGPEGTANIDLASLQRLPKGHKLASPAAVIGIICFFLPWIMVSCGNQEIVSFSGWELAAGTEVSIGFGQTEQLPGSPELFLVLLPALAVLALAYRALRHGSTSKFYDGTAVIGLGALALVVALLALGGEDPSELAAQGITVDYRIGYWGTVLAYIGVTVGGILNIRTENVP